MVRSAVVLVLAVLLLFPASLGAAEQGSGVIEGRLKNGTAGGGDVSGIAVTLAGYDGNAEVISLTTTSNAEGQFTFGGLRTDAGLIYQATAKFLDTEYFGEPFHFAPLESSKAIEITVYETTDSDAAISIAIAHTVVYLVEGATQVEKYYVILNEGDRAFIGSPSSTLSGKKETLRLATPPDAVDTEYLLGLDGAVITAAGIIDTEPLPPGGKEIAYSFRIPVRSGKYALADTLPYAAARYDLLLGGEGIRGESSQLTAKGQREIQGMTFQHFSGSDIQRGQTVTMQLSGLRGSPSPTLLWIGAVVAAAAAVVAFRLLMNRRRRQPAVATPAVATPYDSALEDTLLARLAKLDDDFSDGQLAEDEYRRQRDQAKAELLALMSKKG